MFMTDSCDRFGPGHNVHWIQRGLASRHLYDEPPLRATFMWRDGCEVDVWLEDHLERWRFHDGRQITRLVEAWKLDTVAYLLPHGLLTLVGVGCVYPCRDESQWRACTSRQT
jgi:hypothetical protein